MKTLEGVCPTIGSSRLAIGITFIIFGGLHHHAPVSAATSMVKSSMVAFSPSSSSSKQSLLSDWKALTDDSHTESTTLPSSRALSTPTTSYKETDYWTAFINISYIDKTNESSPVYHTAHSETGRYSAGIAKDVRGIAVKMISESDLGDPENKSQNSANLQDKDITGCYPPFVTNYPKNEPWIAVIKRGHCTFNEKIKNAMDLNASGVLVYDDKHDNLLHSMKGKMLWFYDPMNIKKIFMQIQIFSIFLIYTIISSLIVEDYYQIPSVFTFLWKGREIVQRINEGHKVYMSLQRASHCATDVTRSEHAPFVRLCVQADEYPHFRDMLGGKQSPFWNWATGRMNGTSSHGQKRTSVLFVSVSFIILMLISLAWLIFYYVQRFRYIHAKDQLERKLCNQAKKALQIISTSVLKKDDLEDKDFCDTCAVCIENCKLFF